MYVLQPEVLGRLLIKFPSHLASHPFSHLNIVCQINLLAQDCPTKVQHLTGEGKKPGVSNRWK